MNNLILIEQAYPQGAYFETTERPPCRLYVNKKSLLAIIPWAATEIPDEQLNHSLNPHHNCYLVLVEGYFNNHDKRYNIERYQITVEQFQKIIWQYPER